MIDTLPTPRHRPPARTPGEGCSPSCSVPHPDSQPGSGETPGVSSQTQEDDGHSASVRERAAGPGRGCPVTSLSQWMLARPAPGMFQKKSGLGLYRLRFRPPRCPAIGQGSRPALTYHGDAQQGRADQHHWGQEGTPTFLPERVEEVRPAHDPQQEAQGLQEITVSSSVPAPQGQRGLGDHQLGSSDRAPSLEYGAQPGRTASRPPHGVCTPPAGRRP